MLQRNWHVYSTRFQYAESDQSLSERRFTGRRGLKLPPETTVQVLHCLVEGSSVRSIAYLLGVQKNMVIHVMPHASRLCQRVMDRYLRNLGPCEECSIRHGPT